jgi:hypothetical protein
MESFLNRERTSGDIDKALPCVSIGLNIERGDAMRP